MGLSFSVNLKKNWINFQCRRKNVIMVVYGKSDCGPCPAQTKQTPAISNMVASSSGYCKDSCEETSRA